MLTRFRGSLYGGLMGDCLGLPFEGEQAASKRHLQEHFAQLLDPQKRLPFKPYSDDTAMTKSVCHSLTECPEFNPTDMAKRFVREYFNEPKRGYGRAIHDVFVGLRNSKCESPFRPAQRQFEGMGSYGNGAAMRAHPAALMYHYDQDKALEVAISQAKITHSNKLGYQGAALQALAVFLALQEKSEDPIDVHRFTDALISKMACIEKSDPAEDDDSLHSPDPSTSYVKRLEIMKQYLNAEQPPSAEEIGNTLGVHVSAHRSVPTAIYCYLASQKPLPGIACNNNKLLRCIAFAISLGGDTDTIASMAGAIMGAQVGEEGVLQSLLNHCEASSQVTQWADKLFTASQDSRATEITPTTASSST